MIDIEEKVLTLVTRIEASQLLDSDKDHLYTLISESLLAIIKPVLIAHMDQQALQQLASNSSRITIDAYIKLINDAMSHDQFPDDVSQAMESMLNSIETALEEKAVLQKPTQPI